MRGRRCARGGGGSRRPPAAPSTAAQIAVLRSRRAASLSFGARARRSCAAWPALRSTGPAGSRATALPPGPVSTARESRVTWIGVYGCSRAASAAWSTSSAPDDRDAEHPLHRLLLGGQAAGRRRHQPGASRAAPRRRAPRSRPGPRGRCRPSPIRRGRAGPARRRCRRRPSSPAARPGCRAGGWWRRRATSPCARPCCWRWCGSPSGPARVRRRARPPAPAPRSWCGGGGCGRRPGAGAALLAVGGRRRGRLVVRRGRLFGLGRRDGLRPGHTGTP